MNTSRIILASFTLGILATLIAGAAPISLATSGANCTPTTTSSCNFHDAFLDLGPIGVNPCNGVAVATDVVVTNGNIHLQMSADGTHAVGVAEGTFSFTQTDGVTYSGHGFDWFTANMNSGGTFTTTGATNLKLTGSDGSSLSIHALDHLTITPDGTITSDINTFRVSCG